MPIGAFMMFYLIHKFIHNCDSSPIVKIIYRLPKSVQKIIYYSIILLITRSLIVPSQISNVSWNTYVQCILLCCMIWIIITLIITSCIIMWCIVVNRWPLLWVLDCLTYMFLGVMQYTIAKPQCMQLIAIFSSINSNIT